MPLGGVAARRSGGVAGRGRGGKLQRRSGGRQSEGGVLAGVLPCATAKRPRALWLVAGAHVEVTVECGVDVAAGSEAAVRTPVM
jgi:hypothetical protein